MILVDTSVWIAFFRGRNIVETRRLESLIKDDADLCTCGVILTEILQGLNTPREVRSVSKHFDALVYLPMSRDAYILAADISRSARRRNQVIRRTVDCLIAACAISNGVSLLHNDGDFVRAAAVSRLKIENI